LKNLCKHNGLKKKTQPNKNPTTNKTPTKPEPALFKCLPSSLVSKSTTSFKSEYMTGLNRNLVSFLLQTRKISQDHILFSSIPRSGKAPYFNSHLYDHSIVMVMYAANQNKT